MHSAPNQCTVNIKKMQERNMTLQKKLINKGDLLLLILTLPALSVLVELFELSHMSNYRIQTSEKLNRNNRPTSYVQRESSCNPLSTCYICIVSVLIIQTCPFKGKLDYIHH
ncbi:hypothetical protein GDO78_008635 [Eleutherodactylus coqui]|uniref:Uncharacterized protein n=1 Tax=Eleutherodactylus coqui TaxID=57060 RepID=A0A8J6FC96_ELECQ|nr:hypothetical protein GDO78_008635 [Eleutherodactylus coqui]